MKLIFLSGPSEGSKYKLKGDSTIGRDPSNAIPVDDPSVSLIHCRIHFDDGIPQVTDLGSTNGISVNGERVISAELSDGDCLGIGKSKVRIELPAEEKIKIVEKPPVTQNVIATIADGMRPGVPQKKVDEELSGNIFGSVTYFLERKIADGGMGAVYEAEQFGAEGFIKKVAIKTILPSFAKKDSFVTSFVGEARLVANLVHQNIVQIHHLGRHEEGYYIAMEYIDGITLTEFMFAQDRTKKDVPVDIATFIVSRVCRGLEYAHGKRGEDGKLLNLVHRDVSPNNIMITSEGEVKLTDFGVAKAAEFMEDDEGYLVGSVEYMSPEQASCAKVDGRSDIFSLGLVYYDLLTGVRVFQCHNNDIDDSIERVKEAEIPDPREYRPELSDDIVKILMKCLKKKPSSRYATAGELGYELEKAMYSQGYGPTIVTLAKYLQSLAKRKK